MAVHNRNVEGGSPVLDMRAEEFLPAEHRGRMIAEHERGGLALQPAAGIVGQDEVEHTQVLGELLRRADPHERVQR